MAKAKTFKARVAGGKGRVEVVLPTIVGVTRAAELLGVPKSNVSRLREQGRMPEPMPQDGPGAPVFLKDEVDALARVLQRERDKRARGRAEHEG